MSRLRPNRSTPMQLHSETLVGRQRVTLTPGHSLMDWIRLGREKGDLSGGKRKEVTVSELAQHNTETDLWMAVRGKVYNITPYLDFHPGGISELMRAAGADGTELFEEIHSWVNVESMLSKCYVGPLMLEDVGGTHRSKKRLSLAPPFQPPPIPSDEQPCPTYDWYQTAGEIKVVIYTKHPKVGEKKVVVDVSVQEVIIETYIKEYTYVVHFKPSDKLEDTCRVATSQTGSHGSVKSFNAVSTTKEKVEITFKKKTQKNWDSLGTPLNMDNAFVRTKFAETRFWEWTAVSNIAVSHDTRLIGIKSPPGTRMLVPIGYHFIVHHEVEGMELARSYTVVLPSLLKDKQPSATAENLVYLMIKKYKGGAISPWITNIKAGGKVKLSRFDGSFDADSLNDITHLYMFAAGTGFTSMIRPLYYVLYDRPSTMPPLRVTLVFYNKTVDDILWKDQLDHLANVKDEFSVVYSLSGATPSGWSGLTGRVTKEHFKQYVQSPSNTVKPLLLVCGQFAFNDIVEGIARTQLFKSENIHVFSSTT